MPGVPNADALLNHIPGEVELLGHGDGHPHLPHPIVARRLFSLRQNTERGEPDVVIGNDEFHAGRLSAPRIPL